MLVTLLNYILLDLKIPAWITFYNLNIMFKGTSNSRNACAIYFYQVGQNYKKKRHCQSKIFVVFNIFTQNYNKNSRCERLLLL